MKNNRNYLKIGGIIGILYSIYLIIDLLFIKHDNDSNMIIASMFIYVLSIIFSIIMINESRKSIDVLKVKKTLVIISSIWLFLQLIIPGVFGFMFLGSLKPKKELKLPDIKENVCKKDYIKYIFLLIFFVIIMFILPKFVEFNFTMSIITYIVIFMITILITKDDLTSNFKVFKDNKKVYFKFVIKRYLYMLLTLVVASIPVLLFKSGKQSVNQQLLNSMFNEKPLFIFILTTLYAPIVEELIFRLSIRKFVNKKILFILLSGILFGLAHVIDDFKDISDILYVIQYSALGVCLAKAYYDSKNIFSSISMHFIQNFIASCLMLLIQILGSSVVPMIGK